MPARTGPAAGPAAARSAGLRYVADDRPGVRRLRRGRGFSYRGPDGERLTAAAELARICALAVPPAWTDVWICPHADGHLQATGRDARGRKQYRYHPEWRRVRDADKFDRLASFAAVLPALRRRVRRDLAAPGLSRRRVLAALVRLLETSLIRVGNQAYARDNASYGLTTLEDRHVEAGRTVLKFEFRGKGGRERSIEVRDPRLARIVRRCQELPGQRLFGFVNGSGEPQDVNSADVNEYLRDATGGDFTAKDFRTWVATVEALGELSRRAPGATLRERQATVREVVEAVAERLGNTVAICKKCYIHPAVIEAGLAGEALPAAGESPRELRADERVALRLLRRSARKR